MFMVTSFTVARRWKQPKCPPADDWINKMWSIHTERHSGILSHATTLINFRT